jgi:AraC-like DNA-binding protein
LPPGDGQRVLGGAENRVERSTGLNGLLSSARQPAAVARERIRSSTAPLMKISGISPSQEGAVLEAAGRNQARPCGALSGNDSLSISEIAWLLGYRDIGAFSLAYKLWTGNTPRRGCCPDALIP